MLNFDSQANINVALMSSQTFIASDNSDINETQRLQANVLKLISILTLIIVPILWGNDAWLLRFVHPIDRIGYPALILAFGSVLILLQWNVDKYYTLAAFLGVGTFALHMGAFLQNFLYGQKVMLLAASSSSLQWFPLVYVLLFLFLEHRYARVISVIFYLSFFIPLCIYSCRDWQTLSQCELFPLYLQIAAGHPFYILALSYIELVQRKLAQASVKLRSVETDAMSDYLTGIPNRRASTAVLHKAIENNTKRGTKTTVMLFDIDHFKRVNDTFGHDVGDEVLIAFTTLIKNHIRNDDTLGRWGGEEFILILPNAGSEKGRILSNRLCNVVAKHSFVTVGKVTTSIGISISQPDDTVETLVKRADVALYDAKQSGRNRAVLS
ncbi:MAG: diguanylate cyclase domain-containing protein [Limnospira sp.]